MTLANLSSMRNLLCLLLLVSCAACNEETEQRDIDYGYDYYPLSVGNEWVYAYDSVIVQRQLNTTDTLRGFLRERLFEEADSTGEYRIERDWRREDSMPWQLTDIWSIRLEENRLVKKEENLPFIKLVFPVRDGDRWDGLGLFEQSIAVAVGGDPIRIYALWDDFEYRKEPTAITINDVEYDDVITVVENETTDLGRLELRNSLVQYARGVGPISIVHEVLDCRDCDPTVPWSIKGDRGYTLHQRLISFR